MRSDDGDNTHTEPLLPAVRALVSGRDARAPSNEDLDAQTFADMDQIGLRKTPTEPRHEEWKLAAPLNLRPKNDPAPDPAQYRWFCTLTALDSAEWQRIVAG